MLNTPTMSHFLTSLLVLSGESGFLARARTFPFGITSPGVSLYLFFFSARIPPSHLLASLLDVFTPVDYSSSNGYMDDSRGGRLVLLLRLSPKVIAFFSSTPLTHQNHPLNERRTYPKI